MEETRWGGELTAVASASSGSYALKMQENLSFTYPRTKSRRGDRTGKEVSRVPGSENGGTGWRLPVLCGEPRKDSPRGCDRWAQVREGGGLLHALRSTLPDPGEPRLGTHSSASVNNVGSLAWIPTPAAG